MAEMTQSEQDAQFIKTTLQRFMTPPFWLDAALVRYAEIKDRHERVGVCHNIAVAIMRDLQEHGGADGWTWCCGAVDGGVLHSWVECRGLRIDMGNEHKLRVRSPYDLDTFKIDDERAVVRRDGAEATRWAEERAAEQASGAAGGIPKDDPCVVRAAATPTPAQPSEAVLVDRPSPPLAAASTSMPKPLAPANRRDRRAKVKSARREKAAQRAKDRRKRK